MSRKAYNDLQRMRQGLLVWGRELPSRWSGHGEDYSARYIVRRCNQTSLWEASAPDGSRLATSARTAAVAKDDCQRHYDQRKSASAGDASGNEP